MFGLSLDWERCPDGVELVTRTSEAQARRRDRGIQLRAYSLWADDVHPDRVPQKFLDALRLTRSLFDAQDDEEETLQRLAHRAWVGSHDDADIPENYLEMARQEIAGVDLTGPLFRYRSDRRVPVRYDLTDLEDPIILQFVNARDGATREMFLSRFGMPTAGRGRDHAPSSRIYADAMHRLQVSMERLIIKAGGEDPMDAINALNDLLGGLSTELQDRHSRLPRVYGGVKPILDFSAGSGRPRLALRPESLFAFMVLEAAMVAANGARLAACEHCGKFFLTGHLTGRRSSAKYCSDRCRVAAMRKRNTATGG